MIVTLRKPDLVGRPMRSNTVFARGVASAKAWKIDPTSSRVRPDQEACLAGWLLDVPWAHPYWRDYSVGVVHLRDIPGVRPAVKQYPEAGYELMICAYDEDQGPYDPDAFNGSPLIPIDVVYQFHGVLDVEATRIGELVVRTICDGRISPDQDFRAAWKVSLDATVAHFHSGKHAIC